MNLNLDDTLLNSKNIKMIVSLINSEINNDSSGEQDTWLKRGIILIEAVSLAELSLAAEYSILVATLNHIYDNISDIKYIIDLCNKPIKHGLEPLRAYLTSLPRTGRCQDISDKHPDNIAMKQHAFISMGLRIYISHVLNANELVSLTLKAKPTESSDKIINEKQISYVSVEPSGYYVPTASMDVILKTLRQLGCETKIRKE